MSAANNPRGSTAVTRAGAVVGPYTVLRSRGSGGMGAVWEARGPGGETVALKLMHSHLADDDVLIKRFRREYDVGSRIQHPNLVRMLATGDAHGAPYIVMELAAGKSLRKLIDKGSPYFHEWEAASVGAQVADALAALHSNNVVHRDLKSSNIMVDRDLHAKVIDYGIARVTGERTISAGDNFMGTVEYSGPEPYFARPQGPESDIYSLGIVIYEMVTGRVPFRSDRYLDTLRMHAEKPPPRLSETMPMVSEQLDNLVYQMLQKRPDQRPTAVQVGAACRSVVDLIGRGPLSASPAWEMPSAPSQNAAPLYRPPLAPPPGGDPSAAGWAQGAPDAGNQKRIAVFLMLAAAGLALVGVVAAVAAGS